MILLDRFGIAEMRSYKRSLLLINNFFSVTEQFMFVSYGPKTEKLWRTQDDFIMDEINLKRMNVRTIWGNIRVKDL